MDSMAFSLSPTREASPPYCVYMGNSQPYLLGEISPRQ
jgi:hypothetical protein